MVRRTFGFLVVVALIFGGVGAGVAADAGQFIAGYLETLPTDFNGIRGEALKAKLDSGEPVFLLDVRERNEFAVGRIEGSVNVPVREVPKNLDKLPQDKAAQVVVICAGAVRSGYVVMALKEKGYSNVKHLGQGFVAAWQKAGYPVQK